jgi:hypothetical protein
MYIFLTDGGEVEILESLFMLIFGRCECFYTFDENDSFEKFRHRK